MRDGRFRDAGHRHGIPRQQRAADGGRDREQLLGRVRPHGGRVSEIIDDAGLLGFDTTGLDHETAAKITSWSGMSGAALFQERGKLLLGVVRADRFYRATGPG